MMIRTILVSSLLAVTLSGAALAQNTDLPMMIDDQGHHPSILPRGSMEHQHVMRRKQGQSPTVSAEGVPLEQALQACERYSALSTATREKCEIRARQTAARPAYIQPSPR